MNLVARPSKLYLFDYIENYLKNRNDNIGLDAASDRFRNRKLFHTKKYIGVDSNIRAIEKGLKIHNSNNSFGLIADLVQLEGVPSSSIDIVVSTNTLYQIECPDRLKAIKHLSRIVAPDGNFLCELTMDECYGEAAKILKENFMDIKRVYFKNPVSYVFEYFIYAILKKIYSGVIHLKIILVISLILSKLEVVLSPYKSLNRHVLLVCSNKVGGSPRQNMEISSYKKEGDRLYKL